jgi:siroheme synthase
MAAGVPPDLPVLMVENATLPEVRRIALVLRDLPNIGHYGLAGPTLIMLGRVFAPALAATQETGFARAESAKSAPQYLVASAASRRKTR